MGSADESIAFSHLSEDGYWQIWQMKPDGTNMRAVTASAQDKREPAWTTDGRIICRTNNGQAFIFLNDGSSTEEILKDYPRVSNPQFSHDGRFILFTRFDPRFKDIRDIWKADVNGPNSAILSRGQKFVFQPALSYDDQSIAFVKADDNRENHHIWIMDADGSNARALTQGKAQDLSPKFSPDKQWVVFSSNRKDDNFEIYLVNVKTKKLKRLTHEPALDSDPCFSPDGKRIAFVSNRNASQQIWVMDQDGSRAAVLTPEGTESIEPVWTKWN